LLDSPTFLPSQQKGLHFLFIWFSFLRGNPLQTMLSPLEFNLFPFYPILIKSRVPAIGVRQAIFCFIHPRVSFPFGFREEAFS